MNTLTTCWAPNRLTSTSTAPRFTWIFLEVLSTCSASFLTTAVQSCTCIRAVEWHRYHTDQGDHQLSRHYCVRCCNHQAAHDQHGRWKVQPRATRNNEDSVTTRSYTISVRWHHLVQGVCSQSLKPKLSQSKMSKIPWHLDRVARQVQEVTVFIVFLLPSRQ